MLPMLSPVRSEPVCGVDLCAELACEVEGCAEYWYATCSWRCPGTAMLAVYRQAPLFALLSLLQTILWMG